MNCPVCRRKLDRASLLCRLCQRSFARLLARDGTTFGIIRWAAERARRYR